MGLLKHNSLEFSGAVPSTSDVVMLKPHLRIGGTSQFLSLEVERLRSLPTFLLHERISNGRGRAVVLHVVVDFVLSGVWVRKPCWNFFGIPRISHFLIFVAKNPNWPKRKQPPNWVE
jgi:hypothetical protein